MAKKPRKTARNSRAKPRRAGERAVVKGALDGTVTAAELSEIFGLTDERLRQLAAEGMPKGSRGRYPLRDASRWYLEKLRGKVQARDDGGPTRQDIDRDLAALKLKAARGEVFDREEVVGKMTASFTVLSSALETLATRLGRELNLTGDDVKMIRDLVDEMRKDFVSRMATFLEVVTAPDDQQQRAAS